MRRMTRSKFSSADNLDRLHFNIVTAKLDVILTDIKEKKLSNHGSKEVLRDRLERYHKRVLGYTDAPWNEITDVERLLPSEVKKIVKNFDAQRIGDKLTKNSCNDKGPLTILRDRLTRFYLKTSNYEARWSEIDTFRPLTTDLEDNTDFSNLMTQSKNSKNYSSNRSRKSKKS